MLYHFVASLRNVAQEQTRIKQHVTFLTGAGDHVLEDLGEVVEKIADKFGDAIDKEIDVVDGALSYLLGGKFQLPFTLIIICILVCLGLYALYALKMYFGINLLGCITCLQRRKQHIATPEIKGPPAV